MRNRWTVRINANALRSIYRIGRGVVAKLTETIDGLELDPIPAEATLLQGHDNTYELKVIGYVISYELMSASQTIRVLSVDLAAD
jgi:mRNA-degrading endonuclease RelE of RelBE toxin-antitoxin system